ncbi:YadA family autotransporter adhesin, partial [Achromobacter xylosoxidans]
RTVSGLADGSLAATSTDAVNGSQLFATNRQIRVNAASLEAMRGNMAQNSGQIVTLTQEVGRLQTMNDEFGRTLEGVDIDTSGSVVKPHVSAGSQGVAVGSGSSVAGQNGVALGAGANVNAQGSVALGAGSVANRENTVSVGSEGQERQITNVANATEATDAVNLQQTVDISRQASTHTLNQANAYTNRKIAQLRGEVNAGIASAMAMAGMPSASIPGKGMFSMGVSTYQGKSAMAFGASGMSGSGVWVYKVSGATTTRGKVGAAAGAGFHW